MTSHIRVIVALVFTVFGLSACDTSPSAACFIAQDALNKTIAAKAEAEAAVKSNAAASADWADKVAKSNSFTRGPAEKLAAFYAANAKPVAEKLTAAIADYKAAIDDYEAACD